MAKLTLVFFIMSIAFVRASTLNTIVQVGGEKKPAIVIFWNEDSSQHISIKGNLIRVTGGYKSDTIGFSLKLRQLKINDFWVEIKTLKGDIPFGKTLKISSKERDLPQAEELILIPDEGHQSIDDRTFSWVQEGDTCTYTVPSPKVMKIDFVFLQFPDDTVLEFIFHINDPRAKK